MVRRDPRETREMMDPRAKKDLGESPVLLDRRDRRDPRVVLAFLAWLELPGSKVLKDRRDRRESEGTREETETRVSKEK